MKTICFMNLKGGVAKTASTINMAAILASDHQKHVLVIDADSQGNSTEFFGGDPAKGNMALLLRAAGMTDWSGYGLIQASNFPGVDILFGLSDSPHTTNSSPSIPCIWHPGTDLPPVGAEIIAVDDYAFVDSYTYFGDEWLDTTTRWSDIVYWTFVPGNEQKELEDD